MKPYQVFLVFLGGILIGFLICHFVRNSEQPSVTIDVDSAKGFRQAYSTTNQTAANSLTGVLITPDQLTAMAELESTSTSPTAANDGYRIYLGQDASGPIGMVVKVNGGIDDVSRIFKTQVFSPCPTLCDNQSRIMQ